MSSRRQARGRPSLSDAPHAGGNEFPADLAAGPCIETWCPPDLGPSHSFPGAGDMPRAFAAVAHWRTEVHRWAERTGWATRDRPADNACNLARTRHPWSRDYLIERGEAELVDYFEGRREVFPDREPGWQPTF